MRNASECVAEGHKLEAHWIMWNRSSVTIKDGTWSVGQDRETLDGGSEGELHCLNCKTRVEIDLEQRPIRYTTKEGTTQ